MRARSLGTLLVALAVPSVASANQTVVKTDKPAFNLELFGWAQPRFTWQEADTRPFINSAPTPGFTLARARLGAAAFFGEWGKVQVELGMEREIAQPIDAFVAIAPITSDVASLGFQMGQFRVPISRQNLLDGRVYQLPDTALFVLPRYILNRDLGIMLMGDFWKHRLRWFAGIFNGNEAGFGQPLNIDDNFLLAARLEFSPLGLVPRMESDLRKPRDRKDFIFQLGGGAARNRRKDTFYDRSYVSVDAAAMFEGAALSAELYYRQDDGFCLMGNPCTQPVNVPQTVTAFGWAVQASYFPHIPWVHEHMELVGRVHFFDPNEQVHTPANDVGARELDQSNSTWGYLGFTIGINAYPLEDWGNNFKIQASYEIRNETKPCLEGQTLAAQNCTGAIANNILVLQATVGF